ncbi:MAG: hypothetical protein JXB88_24100 [Spirochaetales bacterium]|nr:hypothetical protein [Spirochaetales bacterium]
MELAPGVSNYLKTGNNVIRIAFYKGPKLCADEILVSGTCTKTTPTPTPMP